MILDLTDKEVALLKRLVPELKLWPGGGETPHEIPLSEEDDFTLWAIIVKIKEL